jgi:hypothetical protein
VIGALAAAMILFLSGCMTIEEGPPVPHGVAAHAGGMVGATPVITGGSSWSDDKKTKLRHRDTYLFIDSECKAGPPITKPLSDRAYAWDASGFYIAGGTDGLAATNQVLRLREAKTDASWEKLPSLPEPVESAAGAMAGGTFYVFGGVSSGKLSNRLWSLDTRAIDAKGKSCASLPGKGRAYPAMVAVGDDLIVFGGYAGPPAQQTTEVFDDAYRYDRKADRWDRVEGFKLAGFGWSAVAVDDAHVLLAGRIDERNRITDDVWMIDLRNPSSPAAIGKLVIQTCCATPAQIARDTWWFVGGEPDDQRSRTPRVSILKLAPTNKTPPEK